MSRSGSAKAARRAAAAAGAAASATVSSVVDALTGASDVPADDAGQERATVETDEPSAPAADPEKATATPGSAKSAESAESAEAVNPAESAESAGSAEAVDPAAPTEQGNHGGPTDHAEDTEHTEHAEHPATTGYGTPASDACSVQWDHDGTSAYGTAATARFFVCVEQPGPWGRDAARESHLDRDLGAELDARTSRAGGRFMLVRRPGGHPAHDGPRHVLVAHAGARPDEAWLLTAEVDDVGDLLGLDWGALARGSQALVQASLLGSRPTAPTLLVCTNGRRDVCCAVRGRPLAAHAARVAPGRAWEVSHTGGHRFAPTAVLLPWGQTLARLDEPASEWILAASESGHLPAELLGPLHDRGRSGVPAASQCAESHVRAETGETRVAALWAGQPEPSDNGWEVIVTHADGRRWRVAVTREPVGRTRPESCGKKAIEVMEHRASTLEAWF